MAAPDEPQESRLHRLEHLALALLNEATAGSSPGLLDPDIDLLLDRVPAVERVLPVVACAVGLALSGIAFWVVIIKLWLPGNESPRHYLPRVLRSIGAHSPWPGAVTVGLFALCAAAALFALVTAARSRPAAVSG